MVKKGYIPEVGDIMWIDLNPTRGREQAKVRPALVISPYAYNQKTSLVLACPITSVVKGYPFEVSLGTKSKRSKVSGVVLADHVRSLDWRARNVTFITKAKAGVIAEVRLKLGLLLGMK